MRKLRHPLTLAFALGLALWAGPALSQGAPIGPSNWFTCNNYAQVTGTANTVQQIVALATSPVGPGGVQPRIYVCGWSLTNSATGTIIFSSGTGSNCGTGTVTMTPALNVNTNGLTYSTQIPVVQTGAGQALCVQTSVVTITGLVFYAQF